MNKQLNQSTFLKSCFTITKSILCSVVVLSSLSCETEELDNSTDVVNENSLEASRIIASSSISVSANGDDGNVPRNTLDGNFGTRWSSQGATGKYITYDLGASYPINQVKIAWYNGNQRKSYFQIRVGNSTSSLSTVYNAKTTGSSGSTTGLESYNFSSVSARYIRISCFGNSSNDWNSITEVQINTTDTNPPPPPSGNSPAAVLGITSNTWKINSFNGAPGSSARYYDDITDASGVSYNTYSDPNYFYTDGSWVFFKCYRGLGGSANSGNPRVELREMSNGNLAKWNGSSGTHTMKWTVNVDRLPRSADGKSGVLCFGQIHGPERNSNGVKVDDLIRVQFLGTPDQNTGAVKLKISGYITEKVLGGSKTYTGYNLDTDYTFTLTYTGGKVYLYNGSSLVFSQQMNTSADSNYFKVGNYLQSVQGASYTGSYGLLKIKNLSVRH